MLRAVSAPTPPRLRPGYGHAEAAYRGGELGILELVDAQRSAPTPMSRPSTWNGRRAGPVDLVLASGGLPDETHPSALVMFPGLACKPW